MVEQVVANHSGGVGAELGGGPVVGGGGLAQRRGALLIEVIPPQTADALVRMDAPGNHLVDHGQVGLRQGLLLLA